MHYGYKEYSGQTLEELKKLGYKRVSNKYRVVSRLDIPEEDFRTWARRMWSHIPYQEWMRDHYIRVESKDAVEGVPLDIYRKLPGAN